MKTKRNSQAAITLVIIMVAASLLTIQSKAAALANIVYLPLIMKDATPTPPLTSDLQITTLSGTSTPEYVIIQNFGTGAQNMTGWTLVSVVGPQTYSFPSGFVLGAGATVRIESYTGAVNNPPAVLLWTLGAIWNNAGDKAELRDAGNGLISSMCYGSGCP